MRLYPDLGVKNSAFNKTFLRRVETLRAAHDPIFWQADWPVLVAKTVAEELTAKDESGKQVSSKATPSVAPAVSDAEPGKPAPAMAGKDAPPEPVASASIPTRASNTR